ncbi:hypothetical protein M0805_007551 [Coniferiporia weirii]|nr:hypothetical protein M0805_007551 [Coniferiporia weirii]
MFGNSSWTNPQQNQQQQQQPQQPQGTSAFGQPNAFGSGGTGAFGAFGQNNQQQPPVNPMFGAPANTANTSGTSGFGTFGGGTSAFGAPKPSGFGAFGGGTGTSAFGAGNTGAFGQTNAGATGTTTFGQPSGTTNAFGGGGGGGGLFGQKPAAPTGAFGSTSTGQNAGTGDGGVAPVTTGSSNPLFQVFTEKDTNGPSPVTLHYQSISMMPAYRGSSAEEIRLQDYAQGRKTAGGFGQSATFGLNQPQPSTSAFGQPAAGTTTFGGFGQNNQQPSTTQPTNAFGSFGQPSQATTTAFGGGTGSGGFGTFGQNNQQQQPTPSVFGGGTGAFGQSGTQQPQPTTSVFGGGGAFGQNNNQQPKPFGTFGTTGTGAFGSFGQNNSQQPGQTSTTGNVFGQPANQNQGTGVFGGFGAANTNNSSLSKPGIFGQPAPQPTTGGFGLFGQNSQGQPNQQQQQQQQPQQPQTGLFGGTGTGLFGQNNQQQGQPGQTQNQTQPTSGLFGQSTAQPAPTGLFGTGGSTLFGNNQNKTSFGGGGIFGSTTNQPANTGTTQPHGSLFGQPLGQSTAQPAAGTSAFGNSSLFGQKPATTNTFGQSTTQAPTNGLGGSLFGGSTLGGMNSGFGSSIAGAGGAQGAGTLTASVAQPVQTNLPIFSLLQSGPQATSIDPPPKKMSSYFVDVPTRSPLGLSSSRLGGGGKLRGFGFSQSSAGLTRNNGLSSTLTLSTSAPSPLALSRGGGSLLGPEAFLGNGAMGSDGKQSPKKLVLDKKMDPSEVFGRAGAKNASASGSKVAFNPAMSMAAREKELFANPSASKSSPAAASPAPTSPGKKVAPLEKGAAEPQEGDYYVEPPLDVLRSLSNGELSSFEELVVGRKGFGEVHFLEPVDLTALPRLSALLGRLIQIDNKEVCVYPDSVEGDDVKPPPGEGINVRARIILLGCWPVDKASREPITDDKHPLFTKHLKRLKNMKHTHFESYAIKTGTWTFTVDHF